MSLKTYPIFSVRSWNYKQTITSFKVPIEAPVCTFKKNGSFTIEAAVSMSLVIFILATFMWIMHAISTQYVIKSSMYKAACDIAVISKVDDKTNEKLRLAVIADCKTRVFKDKKYLRGVKNGILGISFKDSSVTNEYVKVSCNYSLCRISKLFPEDIFRISDEIILRRYVGWDKSMDQNSKIVYVTKNGKAFHKSRECSFLSLKIREGSYEKLKSYRAKDGAKYKKCNCVKRRKGDRIYIADHGDKAHGDINCVALRRVIRVIEEKEAIKKGYHKCPKCGGK